MNVQITISSKELYNTLKAVGKVVNNKNTMPVLDGFLFEAKEGYLTITGSDLETTIVTSIETPGSTVEGFDSVMFLVDHKILLDGLKELYDQPVTIYVNDMNSVQIVHSSGQFNLVGMDYEQYPDINALLEQKTEKLSLESHVLVNSLRTVLPFIANDELRPVINSVFCQVQAGKMYFVASNANYLAELVKDNVDSKDIEILLSPKASKIIADLAGKEEMITLEIGERNIKATFGDFTIISRLVDGRYPNYRGVMPKDNSNIAVVDVAEFKSALRRVTVFANKNSNLITIKTSRDKFIISGKDIDFSISATETISCQYPGEEFEIGLKAPFLQQCLQAIESDGVRMSMSDPLRAVLFTPFGDNMRVLTILLMPMMINA
ncbi:DNA polymerase III subunit beta [Mariniphaga sediminis]|uniref:DNA polymerase III subunit beta n=1 Tax=Mariniphaga sediminis TaxID=1628158 RepID=UPI003567D000